MVFDQSLLPLVVFLAIWDMIWKIVGMWKAARNGQKYWFVVLMLLNSVGILPIVYLKFFQSARNRSAPGRKKR